MENVLRERMKESFIFRQSVRIATPKRRLTMSISRNSARQANTVTRRTGFQMPKSIWIVSSWIPRMTRRATKPGERSPIHSAMIRPTV